VDGLIMPHFTLKITPDGLALSVMVGLTGQATATLVSSNQPIPRPVLLQGLIDTASNVTAVAAPVLSQFGLIPLASTTTQGVGGSHPVRLFEVSLTIPRQGTLQAALLVLPVIEVMEWTSPPPGFEALVGLDVLAEMLMLLDGPRKEFTLGD
jgi:hypothetical protein